MHGGNSSISSVHLRRYGRSSLVLSKPEAFLVRADEVIE
jgi:hypothetical protein